MRKTDRIATLVIKIIILIISGGLGCLLFFASFKAFKEGLWLGVFLVLGGLFIWLVGFYLLDDNVDAKELNEIAGEKLWQKITKQLKKHERTSNSKFRLITMQSYSIDHSHIWPYNFMGNIKGTFEYSRTYTNDNKVKVYKVQFKSSEHKLLFFIKYNVLTIFFADEEEVVDDSRKKN